MITGRSHLVVLQQIRVDEHPELGHMAKWRHATIGLGNLFELTDR